LSSDKRLGDHLNLQNKPTKFMPHCGSTSEFFQFGG